MAAEKLQFAAAPAKTLGVLDTLGFSVGACFRSHVSLNLPRSPLEPRNPCSSPSVRREHLTAASSRGVRHQPRKEKAGEDDVEGPPRDSEGRRRRPRRRRAPAFVQRANCGILPILPNMDILPILPIRTQKQVAHRASPCHCHACARCSAPCTRAHACRARSSRTLHACAPRQPCTCSHVATHACTSKAGCDA